MQISGAVNHVGESTQRQNIFIGDEEKNILYFNVGAGYLEALGLPLLKGRTFDALRQNEDSRSAIVNQTFVKQNKWTAPIGQQFRSDGESYNVIGVVSNFNLIGTAAAHPVAFFMADESQFNYLAIRHQPGAAEEMEAYMSLRMGRALARNAIHLFSSGQCI